VSRSSRRRGRVYQPIPERRTHWGARLLILFVGLALFIGVLAITFNR